MDWITRLLIGTMVAATLFVAIVSGCQSGLIAPTDGGSCAEARLEPLLPTPSTLVDIPTLARILLFLVAITLAVVAVPKTDYADARRRSRAGPRQTLPFYRRLFLPYLCATRDP